MTPPFHIPLAVKVGTEEKVLSMKGPEEQYVFENLKSKPVPSLLRGFSAPVILNYPYREKDLLHLMAHDDDPFNRWEAGQRLAASTILEKNGIPSAKLVTAANAILSDKDLALASSLKDDLLGLRKKLESKEPYSPDPVSMGRRALKNLALSYLSEIGMSQLCYEQFRAADNMTDAMAALGCLANGECPERQPALDAFYQKWRH